MAQRIKTDICIIGAGSGGLSVAAGAAQMGARVVLIEGGEMGGDCLNAGCVPSKALIAAAKAAQAIRSGAPFGIAGAVPQIDIGAVKDHVQRVIETIAPMDSQERFEGFGVTVIRDWARFTGQAEVTAGDHVIRARRFVIATGSRPFVPPIPGIDTVPYLTNETIFALRERPEHLIIIGGGPIGMEMAQAHRRLGSAVTIVEGATALSRDDPDMAAIVVAALRDEGVAICEGRNVVRVARLAQGIEIVLSDGRTIAGSHLFVAAGRAVALDRLNLDAAGVAHTPKGVTVGPNLRSSNRRIYAVGDAAGGPQFTHVAGYHAGVVVRQIVLGLPAKAKGDHLPWVTYTDPELAQVGLSEAAARQAYGNLLQVVTADYAHNDRAQAEAKTKGRIKVMLVKGRPVGATIVGAQAGELIGLWALAISARVKLSAIAGTVLPYPTLNEISKRAVSSYYSPKLFANPWLKRTVRAIQRLLP